MKKLPAMLRFTIRDMMWLTVVVAMGVGWWVDRRGWIKVTNELRSEALRPLIDQLRSNFDHSYNQRTARIGKIYEAAQVSPPTPEVASEMLQLVRDDPDFRVRIAAMEVLPHLRQREEAIDVLIAALRERDPQTTGDGNVPAWAASTLTQMKATRAIPALENWLDFLKQNEPYIDEELRAMQVRKTEEHLATLKAAAEPTSSAPE